MVATRPATSMRGLLLTTQRRQLRVDAVRAANDRRLVPSPSQRGNDSKHIQCLMSFRRYDHGIFFTQWGVQVRGVADGLNRQSDVLRRSTHTQALGLDDAEVLTTRDGNDIHTTLASFAQMTPPTHPTP